MIREILGLLLVLVGLTVIVVVFVIVGWWGLLYLAGSLLVAVGVGLATRRSRANDPAGENLAWRVDEPSRRG